jgi:hypothetical protein
MTTKQIEKEVNLLQDMVSRFETQKETIEEKMARLEDRASERDSGEMTEQEENRYENLENQIYLIDEALENIYTLIDSIEELENLY